MFWYYLLSLMEAMESYEAVLAERVSDVCIVDWDPA